MRYELRTTVRVSDEWLSVCAICLHTGLNPKGHQAAYALPNLFAAHDNEEPRYKGNPLSRQQFYHIISTSGGNAGLSLEIHPHMLRHSCGFALANMGIDTRLIQDYLGHRNIRHTVWYTASNAGRFYGIWDRARGRQRHAVL
ncbi:TPA: tyrosine-type recombinase/integrase [Escherichia coli]|uniref:tyrosine-type recombinase/integrase n=1 Tax=Escherichia coli TaxID=562 RepID=UPI002FC71630